MQGSCSATVRNRQLARWGEQIAADYLVDLGWLVIERNLRCPLSEVDIICLEPAADDLPKGIIVEVKSRSGTGFGDPLEAITPAKYRRLRKLTACWRESCGASLSELRIDAIGVLKLSGYAHKIKHVRGLS